MAFEDRAVRDYLPEFRFQERWIWQQADMEELSLMNEYKPPFHMTDKITNLVEMTIPDKTNSRNQRYRRKQLDR